MKKETKQERRIKRHKRIRTKINGTIQSPRLSVFRSNKYIYAQLIEDNDKGGKTIIALSDKNIKEKGTKTDKAKEVGRLVAKEALAQKIKKIVFDRGGYKYHGRIKALAEGAREKGLSF